MADVKNIQRRVTHLLNGAFGIFPDHVYYPKKRGRKSNRYNHYFKANTPPVVGGPLNIMLGDNKNHNWSAVKNIQKSIDQLKEINGEVFITYKPRI